MAVRQRPHGQCSHCENVYPETAEFFHEHRRRGRIELRAICKRCLVEQSKAYQRANPEVWRRHNAKRQAMPGYREYMREAWRRFHAKPEYREKDRELYRKIVSTVDGHERMRAKVRKRRARIRGTTRHHTVEDIRLAMEVQQGRCFYCQGDVSTKYTVDHLIPLVRGGSDGPENIVIACPGCNFRKADRTPQEFADGIRHRRLMWRNASRALHFYSWTASNLHFAATSP
jgi:5-methylcytosine-specific restriction endonuclease McrA